MNDDLERRQTTPGDVECLRPSEQRIEVSTLVHAMDLARRSWDHDDIVEFGGYAHGVAYNLHKAGVVITINEIVVDPGALSILRWNRLLRDNNITIDS